MFDRMKCRVGFHKPKQIHHTFKHKCRTTDKGRSKKRWQTWACEIVTITYCERCGRVLKTKSKWKRR